MVASDAETAFEAARAADRAAGAGKPLGPLHRVPFTVKDWIETARLPCAAGFEERREFVPRADATAVARMRAAGAILLGKTNVQESNPVYGKTLNPYALDRTPRMSTSGEAALIAAGGSPVGIGSDSGGSLRFPAHCCGLATLKPSAGRVPLTGHFPRISALVDPRTQIGPLSRHVEDLELVLGIIAGEDGHDPSVAPVPLRPAADVALGGLRAAWFVGMPGAEPDLATRAAVLRAVDVLAGVGVAFEEACPPAIADSLPLTQQYWARVRSMSWSRWIPDGERDPELDVDRSLFEWDRFRREMWAFMAHYDLLICPVAERPAGPHGSVGAQEFIYTLPFSLTGWPVATLRAGTSPEGLPIGIQIAARPGATTLPSPPRWRWKRTSAPGSRRRWRGDQGRTASVLRWCPREPRTDNHTAQRCRERHPRRVEQCSEPG